MTKTKYWLSILAISVVLIAGSLAVSPTAIAGGDDDDDDDDDDGNGGGTQQIICPQGSFMTGIVTSGGGITEIICQDPN